MKAKTLLIGMLLWTSLSWGQSDETLTNKTVTDLVKAGLDNDIIIGKISSSPCKFDLSSTGLITLKKSGVPSDIIKAMSAKGNGQVAKVVVPEVRKENTLSGKLDLLNTVYAASGGENKPLEKAIASRKQIRSGLGTKVKVAFELPTTASSVRLTQDQVAVFLIKTGNGTAPNMALYKLEVIKKSRQAVFASFGMGAQASDGGLVLNVSEAGSGTFKMNPTQPLDKGEYYFISKEISNMGGMTAEVFAFGID